MALAWQGWPPCRRVFDKMRVMRGCDSTVLAMAAWVATQCHSDWNFRHRDRVISVPALAPLAMARLPGGSLKK